MEELDGNDSGSLPNISGSESGSESGSDDGSGREDYAMGALSDDDASGSGEEAEDVGDSGGEGESSGAEWASLDTLDAGLDHPESDPGWLPDDSGGEDLQGATSLPLLDRSAAAQHGYLGATEELAGGYGWLDEGQVVALPLLVLFGVVLFPGQQLPLQLDLEEQRNVLARALAAPAPARRLLFVLTAGALSMGSRHGWSLLSRAGVGCTAEVRSIGRMTDDGCMAVVTLGRQRAQYLGPTDGNGGGGGQRRAAAGLVNSLELGVTTARVRVMPMGHVTRVPREFASACAAWGPWEARAFDVPALAARVKALLSNVLPPGLRPPEDPAQLVSWAACCLPLEVDALQALLDAPHPAAALGLLATLLAGADRVVCAGCGAPIAHMHDLLRSLGERSAGAFVNAHGYVHDMVTFTRVATHRVVLQGIPSTECSWFPGYAWQIAGCSRCHTHLGWRYSWAGGGQHQQHEGPGERSDSNGAEGSSTEQGLARLQVFWGLRRPAIMVTDGRGLDMRLALED